MAILLPRMLVILQLLFPLFSSATDTITQFQSLTDNGSTLVSKNGTFELGFFTPGTSPNRYLGIWFKEISVRTIVWVANRENPTKQNTSMLRISTDGNLAIFSQYNESVIWSANSTKNSMNPILQLLDSGNLVLREENDMKPDNYLWQSFDYPTDTLLLGMKLGWDLKTGLNRRLTAWKNSSDPSPGDLIWGMERHSNPEMVMWNGSEKYYRSGPWNGIRFSGSTSPEQHPLLNHKFVNNRDELYCSYSLENSSQVFRYFLNGTEYHRVFYIWDEGAKIWKSYTSKPRDDCDNYNICGSNGFCSFNNQTQNLACQCLTGFKKKSEWRIGNEKGCVRSESWRCGEKKSDGFTKLTGMKVPDTKNSWVNGSMTIEQCAEKCFERCSCSAYANLDIKDKGSGCVIWFGDLVDLRVIPEAGQDLYIRWDPAEIDGKFDRKKMVALITIVVSLSLMMLFTMCCICWRKRKFRDKYNGGEQEDLELPFFHLDTIAHATKDFSRDNMLGKGGFGPVYKGILADGQEIAVKRLSKRSRQGAKEFKNEVILCAKLQHRNLVKVLGYCIHKKEKLLIYEYMPNKSLDSFLFDTTQSKVLDWSKRFHIIYGIARGLLYLHHDSRLRIIHRDLKVSNILLDRELNPKISDFGIARMFREDENEGKTGRVAGTYGYMAPEYVVNGQFSIKSDVFSFGILILEIISGMRNKGLLYPSHGLTLIGHAWRLWKEGNPLEFLDPCLRHSCNPSEVLRCIHIGLLCVQQHPLDRPNMASVVVMLNNESALPQPKEPAFFMERTSAEEQLSFGEKAPYSINEITTTQLEPR